MSTARSAVIRIADLRDPVLTDVQRMAVDATRDLAVDLSVDAVLDKARRRTGLTDFGADDFRERLRLWLRSTDEDEGLAPIGRLGVFNDCVRYAANRLLLEDLLKRHPEILDEPIEEPIIVAGLPRSGTTHLVNLIAADARLHSLPYWESREPVRDAREAAQQGVDPRYERCRKSYEQQDAMMPLLRAMHHMTPEHVHEEIELQALDFSSYLLEWIATPPRWRDYYLAHDQTPHYAYLKKVLQAVQWQRGGERKRWILKSPQHMEQLVPLHRTFPDATIAITHRDPVSVIRSAITMLAYGDRIRRRRVDPEAVAAYWTDRVETLLRACVRDRAAVPAAQSLDVTFDEFMADDVAMVERIYELAGLEMSEAARRRLDAYMEEHPRGEHGQVVYDLQADFGLDPAEVRKRFAFYFERFAVRAE